MNSELSEDVVVWLKIRKNDIATEEEKAELVVVVWLKIRKNDILQCC